METLQRFLAYAGDFEKAFADDQWERLRPHFADDAVYEVAATSFPCRLVGPAAIFAGFKKSLDGFDRRFDGRDIAVTSGPEIDGDEVRVAWAVTYSKAGLSPFVLRGHSTVRCRDGVIAHLLDAYDQSAEAELRAWQRDNRVSFDPSYV